MEAEAALDERTRALAGRPVTGRSLTSWAFRVTSRSSPALLVSSQVETTSVEPTTARRVGEPLTLSDR